MHGVQKFKCTTCMSCILMSEFSKATSPDNTSGDQTVAYVHSTHKDQMHKSCNNVHNPWHVSISSSFVQCRALAAIEGSRKLILSTFWLSINNSTPDQNYTIHMAYVCTCTVESQVSTHSWISVHVAVWLFEWKAPGNMTQNNTASGHQYFIREYNVETLSYQSLNLCIAVLSFLQV